MTADKRVELYPWQGEALQQFRKRRLDDGTVQRFFGAFCGTGAGKSRFGAVWSLTNHIRAARRLQQSGEDREPLGLIVAPTYKHLDRHAVGELEKTVRNTAYRGLYKSQKGEYHFPEAAGGGMAYCGSADTPTSIEGAHVDWCWVDEGGLTKDMLWTILQARTMIHQAPILITSYWYWLQWCYTDMWLPWQQGDLSRKILCFPSTANPSVDPDEFNRIRATMDPRLFQMRHEGKPARLVGQVYAGAWDPSDEVSHCERFDIPKDWPKWIGLDQGYHPSPFHAIFLTQNPEGGERYAFAEYRADSKLTREHAVALTVLAHRLGVAGQLDFAFGDPSNKQGLADLQDALRSVDIGSAYAPLDIRIAKAYNAVEPGIEYIYGAFKTHQLRIIRGACPVLVGELELYHRDQRGNIVKERDHGPDGLRYGDYSWSLRSTVRLR